MIRFILLTEGDPWQESQNGQNAFARSLLTAFADEIAIVCHSTGPGPRGEWSSRTWQEKQVAFFNLGPLKRKDAAKSLIPRRLVSWYATRKYVRRIRALCGRCLVDNPEQLFPASTVSWESLGYLFSGIENPVSNSRYRLLRPLGKFFASCFLRRLRTAHPAVYLAAASPDAIREFSKRTGNAIPPEKIHFFPTRVEQTFCPPGQNRIALRTTLPMPGPGPHLVVVGRLCWIKGWKLLLEAFARFRSGHPAAQLYFVGNGEDHAALEHKVRKLQLQDAVRICGFQDRKTVAAYLSAADLYLCASFHEGWSVAMCEALACGCPIVSTAVSGAADMIREGGNGFIVTERDAAQYAEAMGKALQLQNAAAVSRELARHYRTDQLRADLLDLWPAIRLQ